MGSAPLGRAGGTGGRADDAGAGWITAAGASIALQGFYLSYVLHGVARGIGFAGLLAALFGALYGLLVSEDMALLIGSVLLFVQPLMTVVAGVLIFGEIPAPGQLLGALILFAGVLVAARR